MPPWFADVTECDIRYVNCPIDTGSVAAAVAAVATTTAVATTAAFTTTTAVAATAAFTTAAAEAATAAFTTATTEAAAAATTAIAAAVGAAETSGTLFTRTSLVHHDGTASHGLAIQAIDGGLCFGIRTHFNETETLGTAGVTVHHDLGRVHGTVLGESVIQILIAHAVGQIAHVKFVAHERAPFNLTK